MNSKAQVNAVLVGAIAVLVVAIGAVSLVYFSQTPQVPLPKTPLELCNAQNCTGTVQAGGKNYLCGIDRQGQCRTQEIRNGNGSQPVCGNGIKETGEQCDDGNNVSGDGCSSSCIIEGTTQGYCGDGTVQVGGEECETDSDCSVTDECTACTCVQVVSEDDTIIINEPKTSVGFTPLTDFASGEKYQGFDGFLYPDEQNTPPQEYLDFGLQKSAQIQPINGKIGVITIGMSNTNRESEKFLEVYQDHSALNPDVVLINGARGFMAAEIMSGQEVLEEGLVTFDEYWNEHIPNRLAEVGATAEQVQVAWIKQALLHPGLTEAKDFPDDAEKLQFNLKLVIDLLKDKFPNLKFVYVSSRTYGGCATTNLNPEPYAFQTGFGVKWLVEDYIENPDDQVYVAWGPYLWADGTNPRDDGFYYVCSDFREGEGTHPEEGAKQKVADLIHEFLSNDPTSKEWYLG